MRAIQAPGRARPAEGEDRRKCGAAGGDHCLVEEDRRHRRELMDENAMLRIERRRLVEEFVDALKQHLEDKKELIAARRGD